MVRNRIEVVLDGKDNLTGTIRNAVFQAGLLERGLSAAFSAIQGAVGAAVGAFKEASAAQLDTLKSVSGLQNVFSLGYDQAEALNLEITEMLAKLAAPLPGTTDDYLKLFRQISDDVAIANKELNGGTVNLEQYKDQIGEITSKWTILGQGLTVFQRNNALRGILSGDSLKQLRKLEFFEANPQVMKALEQAQELADKPLQKMNRGERLQVLLDALDVAMTDDTLKRMTGTLDAQVQTFMSTLFDPTTGIFGFQRDLDRSQKGVQSAFTGIAEAIAALLAPDGLFFAIGDLLGELGFKMGDPMMALRNAGLFWAERIQTLADALRGGASVLKKMGRLDELFSEDLAQWINETSVTFAKKLEAGIPALVAGIDRAVVLIGKSILFTLQNINWGAIFSSIGRALQNIPWNYDAMRTYLMGFAAIVGAGLAKAGVVAIAAQLAPAIALMFNPLVAAMVIGGGLLVAAYAENWDDVVYGFTSNMGELWGMITSYFGVIRAVIQSFFLDIKLKWLEFKNSLPGWIQPIADAARSFLQAIANAITNLIPGGGLVQGAVGAIGSMLGGGTPDAAVPSAGAAAPNAAEGFPGIMGGLFNELRQMPSGAKPVIANSSEAILNRQQQTALMGGLSNRGAGIQIGSISINTQATDAEGIARDVMRAIEDEYRRYEQSRLSAIAT